MIMTLDELKKYIQETSTKDLYAPDDSGKNIFDRIALCLIGDKKAVEALIELRDKDRKLFFNSQKIPDWFFKPLPSSSKSAVSPAAKFNAVAATSGGQAFASIVASAPSSKKAKKSLILSNSFFVVGDGEFRDQVLARRIEQINKLREQGFAVYCKETDGAFNLLDTELKEEDIVKITTFNEDDYEIFCEQFPAIARDDTVILDEIKARELNTLFCGRYQYLSDSIDIQAQLGYSKLRAAVELDDISEVRAILDKTPSQLDSDMDYFGATCLHVAALNGHTDVAKLLLDHRADPNLATTDNGATPLSLVAQSGHTDIAKLLLEHGADKNKATTNDGATSLYIAAQEGHEEVAKLLLDHGADASKARTDDGSTPLYIAAQKGHIDVIKELIAAKVDLNKARTDDGSTPLMLAALKGHTDIAKLLLDRGADANKARTDNGATSLYTAAQEGHEEVAKLLLDHGADASKARASDGATPLYIAAQKGHIDIVKLLLEKGADVNKARTDNGSTPLYIAAQKGHIDVIKELIAAKVDLNKARTDDGATPLYAAARKGHIDVIKELIAAKVDLNKARTDNGATSLYVAAQEGHEEVAKLLLDHGADINKARTDNGVTPLYIAAANGHTDIAKLLLEKGADVNKGITYNGATPLFIATANGHTDIANLLLDHRADPNLATTDNGNTALMLAALNGHTDIANLLLDRGADKNKATTEDGSTPLFAAAANGRTYVATLLLENGADINQARTDGSTPLFAAAFNGHTDVATLLLENGADINKGITYNGATPLFAAAENGHTDIANLLLEKGADKNKATTNDGSTPLMLAALKGREEVAKLLLDHRADPNLARTDNGVTPLFAAAANGHTDVATLLLENGADINKATTNDGSTPLFAAALKGREGVIKVIKKFVEKNKETNPGQYKKFMTEYQSKKIQGLMKGADNKIRFASGKVGDSDREEKGQQTFNMGDIGEPLNSDNVPKIRDGIEEVCGNKKHLLLKVKKPQQYNQIANFQELVQASIDKAYYSDSDSQQDGEFHLLHYHDESKKDEEKGCYLTKLLSVHCQDQLQAVSANNNTNILDIFQDEDGFYHVATNKPCTFSYVLKIPPQQRQSEVVGSELQKLIADYKKIRGSASTKATNGTLEYKGKKYNHPGDIQFPRSDYNSNKDWLEAIYQSGGGACRDRVKAFDYMAKEKRVPADSYRIVGIDNNHVAIEVKNRDGIWQYHDLGGRRSNLVNSGKDLRQRVPSRIEQGPVVLSSCIIPVALYYVAVAINNSYKEREEVDSVTRSLEEDLSLQELAYQYRNHTMAFFMALSAVVMAAFARSMYVKKEKKEDGKVVELDEVIVDEVAAGDEAVNPNPDIIKQFLTTNSKLEVANSISQVTAASNGKSLLVAGKKIAQAANKLIFDARNKGRAVFYLDDPSKIDIFTNVVTLQDQRNPQISQHGFLAEFLARTQGQQPLILVNWDAFTPKQQVALNTMLDDRSSIQGESLEGFQIVSLVSKEPTDQSFLSRHQQQLKLAADVNLELPSFEFDPTAGAPKTEVIDFEGYTNWRQKLFGDVKLSQGQLRYQQSNFVDLLSQGEYSFEFKNISKTAKAELQYQLQQAKAFGYFSYQGRQIAILPELEARFTAKSFDFTQFAQPNQVLAINITNNVDISQFEAHGNNKNHIINTRNFDRLLHDKQIIDGTYSQTPGLINLKSKAEDKNLNLFITSQLSEEQYYCLFNEAKKHDVKLNLNLAPNVQIPESIAEQLEVEVSGKAEQKTSSSSSSAASVSEDLRSHANITVTNDANQHLETLKINPGTIILDIEDYSYADLVEKIDYTLTDDGQFKFSKTASQLIAELEKGRQVILKGQISEELLLDLQRMMVSSKFNKNLTIIHEERDIDLQEAAQQFSWLGADAVQVTAKYRDDALPQTVKKESDPRGTHPEPRSAMAEKDPSRIEAQAIEFIEKRRQVLHNMVKKSPIVRLTGPSGVGKSSLMRDLHQDDSNDIKVYNELSSLAAWSQDQDPTKQKTLFIDEANIDDMHYTMFAPLLRATVADTWPATILHDGQLIELTKQHKVVFAGNPITYGGGRSEQKLFTDYQVPTFEMQDFRGEYIYQKLLKEAIFDKVNLEESTKQQLQQGFLTKCQGLVLKYLQVNARARGGGKTNQVETVRELQGYALDYLATTITKAQKPTTAIKSDSYITTTATKQVEEQINKCLTIRKLQQQGILPVATGLGGIFLEGGSGIGKSSIIEAMIHGEDHIKIDASIPPQQKIELLTKAFEQGKIVQIDELNSSIDDGLEKALNAVLTGHHPETGAKATTPGFLLIASANKASMAGRSIVSPALRHRMHCPQVPELTNFKQQDIETMVNHWSSQLLPAQGHPNSAGQQNITTQQIAEKFHQAIQEGTSNLRDLKQAMAKIIKDPDLAVQGQKLYAPSRFVEKPTLTNRNRTRLWQGR